MSASASRPRTDVAQGDGARLIGRRRFLALTLAGGASCLAPPGYAATAVPPASPAGTGKEGLALALGGGAAKAFAHIPVLEVLDELGVRPVQLAGTSMGAILASLYAAGMSGRDIRAYAIDLFVERRALLQKLFLDTGRPLSSLLDLTRPAIIDPVVLFQAVLPADLPATFEALSIPVKIVATDFHAQDDVVLDSGPLLPAIAASSALPVLLTPVRLDGRVLIDGGFTNPTPFDVLDAERHATVAVDVTGIDVPSAGELPGALETWMGSFSIVLHALVTEKLKSSRPDLLISPPVGTFQTMDFFRLEELLATVDRTRDDMKRRIAALLDAG